MMLNLSNLKVDIEGSRILNGISLSVAAGELVCLVGRNGAGKTTTFRSIMGYRRALSGDINFDGSDLTKLPTWQIAQRGRRRRHAGAAPGGCHHSLRGGRGAARGESRHRLHVPLDHAHLPHRPIVRPAAGAALSGGSADGSAIAP